MKRAMEFVNRGSLPGKGLIQRHAEKRGFSTAKSEFARKLLAVYKCFSEARGQ
jgi:hypothetical protein